MKGRGWILAAALTAFFGSHQAFAAGAFTLTSSDFKDGERLPQKFAGNNKANPNCLGENVSPELSWSNPPEGTKSFALMMFDPEGRPPGGVSHFVVYGIPASVTSFAQGELSKPGDKFVGGLGTAKLSTLVLGSPSARRTKADPVSSALSTYSFRSASIWWLARSAPERQSCPRNPIT